MDAPVAGLLLICLLAAPVRCLGQEQEDLAASNLTRKEWRQRVDEARRRSEAFVANARSQDAAPFSPSQLEREAMARAMLDPTLRPGDIVATDKGFAMFVGKDEKHQPGDFVLVPNSK